MIAAGFQNFSLIQGTSGEMPLSSKILNGLSKAGGDSFGSIFEKFLPAESSSDISSIFSHFFNASSIQGDKESSLMSMLLSAFNKEGASASETTIDSEGLALLGRLMKSLGFDDKSISRFMSGLKGSGNGESLSLSTLMTKVNTFLSSGESHDQLEMNATPYIESILAGMGVKPDTVTSIMDKVRNDSGEIDIQALIGELEKLSSVKTDDLGRSEGLQLKNGSALLLRGVGLQVPETGTVSLNEFISGLRQMVEGKTLKNKSGEEAAGLAKALGQSITESNGKIDGKGGLGLDGNGLNNHSFQKQQQMLESSFAEEKFDVKSLLKTKVSGEAGAVLKGGDKIASGSFAKTVDDSTGQMARMVMTSETVVSKSEQIVFRAPTEKTLPSYLTNQVGRQIVHAVKNGETEISFRIKPPEMGRLQISLEFSKEGMKVGILAENNATREMLAANTSELRSILADQGIRLDKVQVDVSGHFGQSLANTGKGSDQSESRRGKSEKEEVLPDSVSGAEPLPGSRQPEFSRQEPGRLSLVV